jgi:ABC-type lipopolysaccharide export system ATPase subunit
MATAGGSNASIRSSRARLNATLAWSVVDYLDGIRKGQTMYSGNPQSFWSNEEVKSRYLGI